MYLLVLFTVQKKNLRAISKLYGRTFLGQNDQITPNKIFFRKTINIIFMPLLAPFIVQNRKTILTTDSELWSHVILDIKWSICPKQEFFWKSH